MTIQITTPVGRIVQGKLWEPQEVKDQKGNVKIGADGKPLVDFYFALAIAKTPGHTHWSQTDWGRQVWEEGNRAHPTFAPHPNFSWKIEDGDSQIPNKKGKRNCDREGFPAHWILKLRSGFAIPTYNADGSAPMPANAFTPGNFAQVLISVKGNTGETPGVYLNPVMAALSGYGAEIVMGPDASEAGFGAAPLPAGASAAPLAAPAGLPTPPAFPPGGAAVPTPLPVAPVAQGLPLPGATPAPVPPVAPPATTFPSSPAPVAVAPNPAFLAGPAVAAPPPAPQMTAAAGGATYEQFKANGWTDEAMRASGYLV